jgi:hypothetical protein
MAIIYRLLSGAISRPDAEGVMKLHRAPYDFVPLPSELAANKWRMVVVRGDGSPDPASVTKTIVGQATISDPPTSTAVKTEKLPSMPPVTIAENTQKKDIKFDIDKLSKKKALEYISGIKTTEELDRIFNLECEAAAPREDVITAIETRRTVLVAQAATPKLDRSGEGGGIVTISS